MTTLRMTNPTPEQLRQIRTRYNFDAKYKDLGGVDKLMEFVDSHARIDDMASHFPITDARVSQILEVLLGKPYSLWLAEQGVRRKKIPHEDNA